MASGRVMLCAGFASRGEKLAALASDLGLGGKTAT